MQVRNSAQELLEKKACLRFAKALCWRAGYAGEELSSGRILHHDGQVRRRQQRLCGSGA